MRSRPEEYFEEVRRHPGASPAHGCLSPAFELTFRILGSRKELLAEAANLSESLLHGTAPPHFGARIRPKWSD